MMCGAILAYQTATVDTEGDRKTLQCHIVNHIIVSSLHERGVDITYGVHATSSQTSREGYGVTLGNTHIEATLGHMLHHNIERAARRHGGGDTHNLIIRASQLKKRLSKDILIAGRRCR